MSTLGISHNGTMTKFTLVGCQCGFKWFLCRDDIRRIANGSLTFDDGRPEIQLEENEKIVVIEQAKRLIDDIQRGNMLAELGEGYFTHFKKTLANYSTITIDDLGRKFIWEGKPFGLLGAKPKARRFHLVAVNLLNGRGHVFTVSAVEQALDKHQNVESIMTTHL